MLPLSRQRAWNGAWNILRNRKILLLIIDTEWMKWVITPKNNTLFPATDSEQLSLVLKFQAPLSSRGLQSVVCTCQPSAGSCLLSVGLQVLHQPEHLPRRGLTDIVSPAWPHQASTCLTWTSTPAEDGCPASLPPSPTSLSARGRLCKLHPGHIVAGGSPTEENPQLFLEEEQTGPRQSTPLAACHTQTLVPPSQNHACLSIKYTALRIAPADAPKSHPVKRPAGNLSVSPAARDFNDQVPRPVWRRRTGKSQPASLCFQTQ